MDEKPRNDYVGHGFRSNHVECFAVLDVHISDDGEWTLCDNIGNSVHVHRNVSVEWILSVWFADG